MYDSTRRKPRRHDPRRDPPHHRHRSWCCSFAVPPRSPENFSSVSRNNFPKTSQKIGTPSKYFGSFPNSPQSAKFGLVGRINAAKILSPGRVSPIDSVDESYQEFAERDPEQEPEQPTCNAHSRMAHPPKLPAAEGLENSNNCGEREEGGLGMFDVRLNLKGKNGGSLVLELSSEVLSATSSVFAELIADHRKNSCGSAGSLCRIEVPDVENLNVFRETIELMFEEDITKRLLKVGVYRSIDILEVSAGIMFTKGVLSCLKYLEAVPWSEDEEDRLKTLFSKFKFDDAIAGDISSRLYPLDSADYSQQNLARQLVWSITTCVDTNAKNELKPLVKALLFRSSVYEKTQNQLDINKEDIFLVTRSCLGSLVGLFAKNDDDNKQPLIERISKQVDNVNWLLEILLDWQMAEEFVEVWSNQKELLEIHGSASPMVRYELSRVSAALFVAIGTRKLHCRLEWRLGFFRSWFGPMLLDFGWLQRCKKGLDIRGVEEAMGQGLLTLPLKEQYDLFMEWFRCFSKNGTECPNLSRAFQIWWRRSFLRGGSESYAVESR